MSEPPSKRRRFIGLMCTTSASMAAYLFGTVAAAGTSNAVPSQLAGPAGRPAEGKQPRGGGSNVEVTEPAMHMSTQSMVIDLTAEVDEKDAATTGTILAPATTSTSPMVDDSVAAPAVAAAAPPSVPFHRPLAIGAPSSTEARDMLDCDQKSDTKCTKSKDKDEKENKRDDAKSERARAMYDAALGSTRATPPVADNTGSTRSDPNRPAWGDFAAWRGILAPSVAASTVALDACGVYLATITASPADLVHVFTYALAEGKKSLKRVTSAEKTNTTYLEAWIRKATALKAECEAEMIRGVTSITYKYVGRSAADNGAISRWITHVSGHQDAFMSRVCRGLFNQCGLRPRFEFLAIMDKNDPAMSKTETNMYRAHQPQLNFGEPNPSWMAPSSGPVTILQDRLKELTEAERSSVGKQLEEEIEQEKAKQKAKRSKGLADAFQSRSMERKLQHQRSISTAKQSKLPSNLGRRGLFAAESDQAGVPRRPRALWVTCPNNRCGHMRVLGRAQQANCPICDVAGNYKYTPVGTCSCMACSTWDNFLTTHPRPPNYGPGYNAWIQQRKTWLNRIREAVGVLGPFSFGAGSVGKPSKH